MAGIGEIRTKSDSMSGVSAKMFGKSVKVIASAFFLLLSLTAVSQAAGKSIVVIGDSLADGLYTGLYSLLKSDDATSVDKKTRISTGLVRYDKYDWLAAVDQIARARRYDTAIVSFGANDLISFRTHKGPVHYKYQDERWAGLYGDRVGEIVRTLRAGGMKVYWVGLPISRKDRYQRDYAFLNTIMQKAATAQGAHYIDTWSAFAVNGAYSDYGTDINGKAIVLRASDGVHFTGEGYISYAKVVMDAVDAGVPGFRSSLN